MRDLPEAAPNSDSIRPYSEVLQGILYTDTNLPLVLFTRYKEGPFISPLRVMVQMNNGEVFTVEKSATKGFFRKRLTMTVKNRAGALTEFNIVDLKNAYPDSVVKSLLQATLEHTAYCGAAYTPDDFWAPLKERNQQIAANAIKGIPELWHKL